MGRISITGLMRSVTGGALASLLILSFAPGGRAAEKTLHKFQGGSDGEYPSGNLAIDNDGNLYGVAGAAVAADATVLVAD
ncbi:MAG TPA: hypothetical protein VHU23_07260 [Rhizomicrobium sp.]|jgi:hypothetical protein|nr:hypothetical protein [Rhizomicrobium sp.]